MIEAVDPAAKEAKLYEKLPRDKVRCARRTHPCAIAEWNKGIYQAREH